jgi:hypothetical protein
LDKDIALNITGKIKIRVAKNQSLRNAHHKTFKMLDDNRSPVTVYASGQDKTGGNEFCHDE